MTRALKAATHDTCRECGEEVQRDWAFCVACATPASWLPDQTIDDDATVITMPAAQTVDAPVRRTRRFWGWRRLLVAGISVIVVAAAIAGHLAVRNDLDRTRSELRSTQDQLGDTRAELKHANEQLNDTKERLVAMTTERDSLRSQLDDTKAQLDGVRGSLSNAESRLNLQAGQISTLKTCLQGVSNALVSMSYSDYSSAIAALDSVSVACNEASNLF